MKLSLTTLGLAFAAANGAVLLKSNDAVEGEYVIKMRSNKGLNTLSSQFYTKSVWSFGSFNGFAAKLNAEELAAVMADPEVDIVSPNVRVYTTGILNGKTFTAPNVTATKHTAARGCPDSQSDHSWGQARVTSSTTGGGATYSHDANWGAGVDVYVTDTGTLCAHEEFAGRSCTCGPDFSAFLPGNAADGCADGNGHGTFCSSIAAGNVYGVAKSANLIGVKVMGNAGAGTLCGITDGFAWVAEQAAASGRPSVASVSLGTQGTNACVDAAANALAEVAQTAIAAGNSGQMPAFLADTCTGSSPGAAENPITVGSMDTADSRSYFSNYGSCLDVFAPGSDITGAYSGRNFPTDQYITGSGTSMATPHVAGLMAAHLSEDSSLSPEALKAKVVGESVGSLLDLACGDANGIGAEEKCEDSPNQLIHYNC